MGHIPKDKLLPLADRPRFARRMVAVWRQVNDAVGEELSVNVMPGEWPEGVDMFASGVPVRFEERVGGTGGVMVLGRIGEIWRMAFQLATTLSARWTLEELATICAYAQVDDTRNMRMWLAPDPITGAVTTWIVPRPNR